MPSAASHAFCGPADLQDGLPGDEVGDKEEADLERVAAEDVAHRERVVAERDRRDAGRDLGQRARRREHRRAEDHAVHADAVRELVAALLEEDAGTERDGAAPRTAPRRARSSTSRTGAAASGCARSRRWRPGLLPGISMFQRGFFEARLMTKMPTTQTTTIPIEAGLTRRRSRSTA